MKVSIIGGGNVGTLLAAEFSVKGYDTFVYSSKINSWNEKIDVFDKDNNFLFTSNNISVTNDIAVAVKDSKFVFVTYPPELFEKLALELDNKMDYGSYLGIIPGSGGAEFAFKNIVKQGVNLFGFQRVHSIARLKEYGHSVYMLGRKDSINIAIFNGDDSGFIKEFLENSLDMPCHILDHYLAVTLNPSNQILHTARLYAMFKEFEFGVNYPKNFLFYEYWDDESSDLLIKCDEELQTLCNEIPFDLSGVKSLKEHYESYTVRDMTNKISNIPAFKGLTSPMCETDEGLWIPDFSSRYFSSDFSYGLKIIVDISELYNIPCENLKRVWNWFSNLTSPKNYFSLNEHDVSTKEYFENYY